MIGDKPQRIICAGSRQYTGLLQKESIWNVLDDWQPLMLELVTGMARGPDRLGEQWGVSRGMTIARFPADWSKGKGAGFERNERMARYADMLVAFWDGQSSGTKDMCNRMNKHGKPFFVYYWYKDHGFLTEEQWHDLVQTL